MNNIIETRILQCKNRLISSGRIRSEDFIPCTLEEIELVKLWQRVDKLPYSYEFFLRNFGKSMGVFSDEMELRFDNLAFYRDYHIDRSSEDWPELKIPRDTFVFSEHLGYAFSTFDDLESLDPEVKIYIMGDHNSIVSNGSFVDWLEESVKLAVE